MKQDYIIGWDIGGAHVKAALIDSDGLLCRTQQLACPLWLGVDHLRAAVEQVMQSLDDVDVRHAVTMTGELADIFSSRAEGVACIVDVMTQKFRADRVKVFAGASAYLAPEQAKDAVNEIASANWLATTYWASRKMPQGLLVDIGSTTTDLIPFADQRVLARGYNDHERLRHDELLYSGIVRTPVMALAQRAPLHGEWIGMMAEVFATSADIYRILAKLPEHADHYPAADQGEKTVTASERRLARMLGMDAEQADSDSWYQLAQYFEECQLRSIMDAAARVLSQDCIGHNSALVGAGVGRFLVKMLAARMQRQYMDFNDLIECRSEAEGVFDAADCAPAVAVAALMQLDSL